MMTTADATDGQATIEISARNPRWGDSTKSWIECEIEAPDGLWVPFNATPLDPMPYGRALFESLSEKIGE